MKASELRIGNYVEEGGDLYEVSQVNRNGQLRLYSAKEHITSGISKIRLISLTEEWLLKFGFDHNDFSTVFKLGAVRLFYYDIWHVQLKVAEDWIDILELYYVHELQNAFYILTGKELTMTQQ